MIARARWLVALAIAGAVQSAGAVVAQAQGTEPARRALKALPSVHEWKLKNRLTVADGVRPGLPRVTVQVGYRFAAADEPAGQRGVARAIERRMYVGSERVRAEDHRRFIEQIGGESSALTTEDVMAFHNAVPV